MTSYFGQANFRHLDVASVEHVAMTFSEKIKSHVKVAFRCGAEG